MTASSSSSSPSSSAAGASTRSTMRAAFGSPSMALLLLLVASLLTPSFSLYFYLSPTDGQSKCFLEEVPAETLIVGTYKNPDFAPYGTPGFNGVGIKLTVTDPSSSVVLTRGLDAGEGRFAFTSAQGGEYQLCFATNSTIGSRWLPGGSNKGATRMRLDLSLAVGESSGIDYSLVAKKEHLSELETEVRKLNDKVKDLLREQQYQRGRETAFRDTSESTNSRVKGWSIIQTVVIVVAGVWQIWHLKRFLKNKKIV